MRVFVLPEILQDWVRTQSGGPEHMEYHGRWVKHRLAFLKRRWRVAGLNQQSVFTEMSQKCQWFD